MIELRPYQTTAIENVRRMLRARSRRAIHAHLDEERWTKIRAEEALNRESLRMVSTHWDAALAACQERRMSAARSQHGGQTVMLFRAAVLSRRFDALHQELHATYTASIAA